jgi:mannose-1-phosphate guanylyltransferase/phosphomannomutase
MRAMILSAGYGTRLWPLTEDRTKPAIPILGKPLVGYVAEYLAGYRLEEIIVNLHHRPDSVRAALGDGSKFGVKLEYIEEPEILGTSGALDNARALLQDETFVVVNGKLVTDIDLHAAFATHRQTRAVATLVLMRNSQRERFSIVKTRDALVTGFGGMPNPTGDDEAPLMFTGIQILEPQIFEYIPRDVFSHSTTDVYPQAIAKGERIAAHVATGKWRELSTLQRYLDISLEMLKERGENLTVGAGSIIADPGNVRDAVLWDKVQVEAGARVQRAIIADNVRLVSTDVVNDAVVVPKSLVEGKIPPAKALQGRVQGENFVVPLTG